jgi:polyferredoxin
LQYQARMMRQLLFWAALSFGAGLPMMLSTREWVRAFGGMTVAWAVINALIALFALRGVRRKAQQNADAPTQQGWMRQLVRLLWVNAALDGVYIAVGVGLTLWDPANRMLHGFGWAVIVQGAFLLVFDAWHGWRLPRVARLQSGQELSTE